jgi:hypothetical protein
MPVWRPSLYHPECFLLLLLLLRRGGGESYIPIRMLLPCLHGIACWTCRRKCRLTAALPTRGFPRKTVTSAGGLRYASTSRSISALLTLMHTSGHSRPQADAGNVRGGGGGGARSRSRSPGCVLGEHGGARGRGGGGGGGGSGEGGQRGGGGLRIDELPSSRKP